MTFTDISPTELVLEVPALIQEQAWQHSQQATTGRGRWNTYLNSIALSVVLPWLQQDYAPTATAASPEVNLGHWDAVNGTAIELENKRLILIPDKTLDLETFAVPQEWIDLPRWAGDYYLAVQIPPEGDWIRIWGYTTHLQLKTQGTYETDDRAYTLDATELVRDLNVLWVVRQLYANEPTQAAIEAVPALSTAQMEAALHQIVAPAIASPRLALPFSQWGALMSQADGPEQLYQLRHSQQNAAQPVPSAQPRTSPVQLGQWLQNVQNNVQNVVDQTWQTIEELLQGQPNLAYSFRQPASTSTAVRRAKLIPLNDDATTVVLIVLLEPEPDARIGIRVQLYPFERMQALPAHLRLSMLSATGAVVQSVEATEDVDYIQLKRFRCAPGRSFSIQVVSGSFTHTELFIA